MKAQLKLQIAGLLGLMTFIVVSPAMAAGDAAAGKAKAQVCFACHGVNGAGPANPAWPKLAGQHAKYTAKQLADFKTGKTRKDPAMAGQVASLSAADMANLGAFFAEQTPTAGGAAKDKVELGQRIYRGGNEKSGVAACASCHSPTGAGNPAANFPRLSGQNAVYTVKALNDFAKGVRSNDSGSMMRSIAERMTDAEKSAVASYIEGLH